MSDKKLDELIEEYGKARKKLDDFRDYPEHVEKFSKEADKAKQAILDYVEKEVKQLEYALQCEIGRTKWVKDICGEVITVEQANQEATKAIRGVYEKLKNCGAMEKESKLTTPELIMWQAIKADGIKAGWIEKGH